MEPSKKRTQYLGDLGEAYVILELAKRDLYSNRVRGCNFDVLCENGNRIEVKSAKPTHHHNKMTWCYNPAKKAVMKSRRGRAYYTGYEMKRMYCDYFVLVAFDDKEQPLHFFVVPHEKAASMTTVRIRTHDLGEWSAYRDNWKQLL